MAPEVVGDGLGDQPVAGPVGMGIHLEVDAPAGAGLRRQVPGPLDRGQRALEVLAGPGALRGGGVRPNRAFRFFQVSFSNKAT